MEAFIMGYLVFVVVMGLIGGMITNSNGRGTAPGFILGLLLGVIGLIIAAVMGKAAPPAPGTPYLGRDRQWYVSKADGTYTYDQAAQTWKKADLLLTEPYKASDGKWYAQRDSGWYVSDDRQTSLGSGHLEEGGIAMSDQRRGASIRGYMFGAATTVLLFALSTTTIVSADGGQTNLIHACILPIEDGGNVRIIGANETCPESTTPLHWPAGEAAVENSEVAPPPTKSVEPKPKVNKQVYKAIGINAQNTKTVFGKLGPSKDKMKDLIVSCPASHPLALAGWSYATPSDPSELVGYYVNDGAYISHAVGLHAWRIVHTFSRTTGNFSSGAVTWTLTVYVKCAKLVRAGT
jgi:hypothetical protein